MPQAIIFGASSDVAMSISILLAERGYQLTLVSRESHRLIPFTQDLAIRFNTLSTLVEFDAVDINAHPQMAKYISEETDLAIIAFGYLGEQEKAENNTNELQQTAQINYLGAISIANVVANVFRQNGKGTLVGISSVAGERGRGSNYVYGSAKAGFTAYLSGLRNSLYSQNIHVITVLPGFIDSKMTKHLHLPGALTSTPSAVAKAILKAINKKSNVIYVKWFWRYIMSLIRIIPEPVFKRMKL